MIVFFSIFQTLLCRKLVLSLGTQFHYIILAIIAYEDLQSESYTWFFGIQDFKFSSELYGCKL